VTAERGGNSDNRGTRNADDRWTRNADDRGARTQWSAQVPTSPLWMQRFCVVLETWMVINEDDGTGTHFPLWDAEVLCQAPEVLCQVGDDDDG